MIPAARFITNSSCAGNQALNTSSAPSISPIAATAANRGCCGWGQPRSNWMIAQHHPFNWLNLLTSIEEKVSRMR